jgi:Leucine-rich repeat (LRR) protein
MIATLAACGPREIELQTTQIERTKLNLEEQPPLKLKNVSWIVITEENYKEVFELLESRKKNLILFGLTDDDYESLSYNLMAIRNYIILNNEIIKSYKQYYEGPNGKGEETRR